MTLLNVEAQYLFTTVPPPPQFNHADVWNFTLTTPNDSMYLEYRITCNIWDDATNLLVKSRSANFPNFGAVLVVNYGTIGQISPITVSYVSGPTYQAAASGGGFFPSGNYVIEFILEGRPSDGVFSPVTQTSYPFQVQQIFPPTLLSPSDGDTLCSPFPVFTWTPAFDPNLFGGFTYNIKIAEMLQGQTAQQALQSNPSHHNGTLIPSTIYNYPPNGLTLVPGNSYAWTVEAVANGNVLAFSQYWSFVMCVQSPPLPDSLHNQFAQLQSDWAGEVHVFDNQPLKFIFEERNYVGDSILVQWDLKDMDGNVLADHNNFPLYVKRGMNYLELPPCFLGINNTPAGEFLKLNVGILSEERYLKCRFTNLNCP